jgi:4-amino-4-deoxy-L-arabinose transferase-like glycosyltransferase
MRAIYIVGAIATAFLLTELFLGARTSNWDFLDDSIYMEASAKILDHQACVISGTLLTVCNYEHPPLVKVLEAISLYAFGWVVPSSTVSNAVSVGDLPNLSSSFFWFLSFRFFQIAMGTLSIPLTYIIAFKISKNRTPAVLAAALLALEPMYAFFARTAYLDVPMIFFALCAYAVYFSAVRLGPINEYLLAGAFLALSVLSKETGVVFLLPLILYHLAFREGGWKSKTREALTIAVASAVIFALGLQLYDSFTATPFSSFLDQLEYMFAFSNSMACKGFCSYPPNPLDWFLFFTKPYWLGGFSNNVFLLWLVLAWVPLGCFMLWRSRRERVTPEGRLFVFSLLLFASTLLENELIYLDRGILVWYYLTIVPSLAFGGAYLLTRPQIPRWAKFFIFGLLLAGYFWAYLIGPSLLAYE